MWVKIRDGRSKGQLVVRVYCRPPDQEEEVGEAFCRQMKVAICNPGLQESQL